jgi:hypothetical protein
MAVNLASGRLDLLRCHSLPGGVVDPPPARGAWALPSSILLLLCLFVWSNHHLRERGRWPLPKPRTKLLLSSVLLLLRLRLWLRLRLRLRLGMRESGSSTQWCSC